MSGRQFERYGKDYIRNKIFRTASVEKPPAKSPENRSGFMKVFLITVVLLLGLANFWYVVAESDKIFGDKPQAKSQPSRIINQRPVSPPAYLTKEEADKWMEQADSKLDAINKCIETLYKRTWLMAAALSENANLNYNMDRKYHPHYQPTYIYLDENWKINKIPETMELTDEERERFRKELRR